MSPGEPKGLLQSSGLSAGLQCQPCLLLWNPARVAGARYLAPDTCWLVLVRWRGPRFPRAHRCRGLGWIVRQGTSSRYRPGRGDDHRHRGVLLGGASVRDGRHGPVQRRWTHSQSDRSKRDEDLCGSRIRMSTCSRHRCLPTPGWTRKSWRRVRNNQSETTRA